MKFIPIVILAALGLAGCQQGMSLQEAQAKCTAQGGLLVIIYSQKITLSGIGPQVASPGQCLSPSAFDKNAPPPPGIVPQPAP